MRFLAEMGGCSVVKYRLSVCSNRAFPWYGLKLDASAILFVFVKCSVWHEK